MDQPRRPPITDAYAEEEERARALSEIPMVLAELVPILERIATALERMADRANRETG